MASLLLKRMKPTIDSASEEPVQEEQFAQEADHFSELRRVLDDPDLPRSAKIELIGLPEPSQVRRFLRTYVRLSNGSLELLICAYILLDRFLKYPLWELRSTNWRILFILSMKVAQKMQESTFLSAGDLHTLYPIYSKEDYVLLESQFLNLLNFQCHVTDQELEVSRGQYFQKS
eukprot:CAMPEP_0115021490 /NCGR_PEP_ID=MMETSP0216-20121206/30924_1 /TAXON_ID=223996 /ORGANISM="Protocruzia adherens, Strain Boccale" /LENGTH=173 /DNA_ID=CAMNT_0002393869 /DNA_START=141 /DNA_END=662 /DNA_ORIENTATION=-